MPGFKLEEHLRQTLPCELRLPLELNGKEELMLKKINRALTAFENFIITVIFWMLVIFNFLNVFTRKLMPEHGMAFVEDLSMLMFLWLVFFAAAQCYTTGSHLGLPFVYDKLTPAARMAVLTLITLFSIFFYGIVIWYTKDLAINQYQMEIRTSMGYPAWIGGAALPIGSVFVTIRMLQDYVQQMYKLYEEAKRLKKSDGQDKPEEVT